MASKNLKDLPIELIQEIAKRLPKDDLLRLRLTCREVEDEIWAIVADRSFKSLVLFIGQKSLSPFVRVLDVARVAFAVQELRVRIHPNNIIPIPNHSISHVIIDDNHLLELGRIIAMLPDLSIAQLGGDYGSSFPTRLQHPILATALRSHQQQPALSLFIHEINLSSAALKSFLTAFAASGSLRTVRITHFVSTDLQWHSIFTALKHLRLESLHVNLTNRSPDDERNLGPEGGARMNKAVRNTAGKIEFYYIARCITDMAGYMAVEKGVEAVLAYLSEREEISDASR